MSNRPGEEDGGNGDQAIDMAKAMRRAYHLGQTYWQQADSESLSQQRKSDETQAKFDRLLTETVAALAASGADAAAPSRDAEAIASDGDPDGLKAAGQLLDSIKAADSNGEALLAVVRFRYEQRLAAARAAQAQGGA